MPRELQAHQSGVIEIDAPALVDHLAIPLETESLESL